MPVTTRASSATPSSKEQLGTQSKISGFFYVSSCCYVICIFPCRLKRKRVVIKRRFMMLLNLQ